MSICSFKNFFLQLRSIVFFIVIILNVSHERIYAEDEKKDTGNNDTDTPIEEFSDESVLDNDIKNMLEDIDAKKKITEGFVWEGDDKTYYIHFWGNLKNLFYYNHINDDSLLNPDNVLNVPYLKNDSQATINFNSTLWDAISVNYIGRYLLQYSKDKKDDDLSRDAIHDQLYVSLELVKEITTFISIGKQRIKWGTGFHVNPVDTFNPPYDLENYEKINEGRICYRLDLASSIVSLSSVFIPNADSKAFNSRNWIKTSRGKMLGAGKLYAYIDTTEYALYLSKKEDESFRYGTSFSTVISKTQLFGEALVWNGKSTRNYIQRESKSIDGYDPVGATNYTIPAIYNPYQKNDFFYKFLIGVQHTFHNNTTLIAEYYHNSEAYTKSEYKNYIQYLKYVENNYADEAMSVHIAKERNPLLPISEFPDREVLVLGGNSLYGFINLRQNYIFINVRKPDVASNRFDLELDSAICVDDIIEGHLGSYFLRPCISYIGIPRWRFSLYSQMYLGESNTDFNLNHYLFIVYLNIQYYF